MSLEDCETEIVRLHDFFVDWFTGQVPDSDEEFQRVQGALMENFHLVAPSGTMMPREKLLVGLKTAYASRPHGLFGIAIKNVQVLHHSIGDNNNNSMWVVSYEEWQTADGTETARLSTVCLQESKSNSDGAGYNNGMFRWIHVHETWMPGMGPKANS